MRLALIALLAMTATAQPARRALLIGIDDYTATSLPVVSTTRQHPDWPDLRGAVNDTRILGEMLVLRYGFARRDVVTLTNQQATRAAIVRAIDEQLVKPARSGDVVFFYFAGHGAQVPNAASDEPDRLDEAIVPADSRRGAADIRDKELRAQFNRILGRGARLTILLDHCYSGSGFRGLPNGARRRGLAPAPPIVDATHYGPRPDARGALVLASTQDSDVAWETLGDDGQQHGAFTWAWIRAMRDAAPGESAQDVFLRAQARLRSETPYQSPLILGDAAARSRPFLGTQARAERTVIAVEKTLPNGDVLLQGGWAHGLAVNTELGDSRTRLRITRLLGLGRSVARIMTGPTLRSGALVEITRFAESPERPLRVFAPNASSDVRALARRFAAATRAQWIDNPLAVAPTHILRPRGRGWELLDRDGRTIALANDDAAMNAITRLRATSSLFVQLPPSQTIASNANADDADYLLAGRLRRDRVEYAWIRPLMRNADRRNGGLPPRTAWTTDPARLQRDLATLRRIHSWLSLVPPPGVAMPYRLALRDEQTRELVRGNAVTGQRTYSLVLRATEQPSAQRRWYYVFVVDSHGNGRLVFPATGSTENHFQPTGDVLLGNASAFRVTPPYGIDTYVLLSTEEPLPTTAMLAWDGVRARRALAETPWSIERVMIESVAPPRRRAPAGRAAPRRR